MDTYNDQLTTEHNELLVKVCELQKRDDAEQFMIHWDAEKGLYDRNGEFYDADIIKAMIRVYKSQLSGERTGFACNPNPYDGVWK